MISARTKLVGLIGWPVEHSLSPAMHNAAFHELDLDWAYVPLPVAPKLLRQAVRSLAALGLVGANVTVPHKQAAMAHVDSVTAEARALGALNTIVVQGGRSVGHNTDSSGFLSALQEGGFAPKGKRALVLGAGGAARAVVGALAGAHSQVCVLNRTLKNAQSLVDALSPLFPEVSLVAMPLTEQALGRESEEADLLVNATSVGMWPAVEQCPWPDCVPLPGHLTVYDLIYRPSQTRLLEKASAAGARTIGGLGMLVHQGAAAFQLWTGLEPPVQTMYRACRQTLRGERCCDF